MAKPFSTSEPIQVSITSEIGRLRAVLLHRPGPELERLTPETLDELLFDDIPWIDRVQQEHDAFAQLLVQQGIHVYELEDLVTEVLQQPQGAAALVSARIHTETMDEKHRETLSTWLLNQPPQELARYLMAGVLRSDAPDLTSQQHLRGWVPERYPFLLLPLPNLYFTRDPAMVIGSTVITGTMRMLARRPEPLFLQTVLGFHPAFRQVDRLLSPTHPFSLEGGDLLVLSAQAVAIGFGQRTQPEAVEHLAEKCFAAQPQLEHVLAVQLPSERAFMHLDTILTMVDVGRFVIYPGIEDALRTFSLEREDEEGAFHIVAYSSLADGLQHVLGGRAPELIACGGNDPIISAREQWNDAANTLALSPGRIITYDRNVVSNRILRLSGLEVLEISGSELSRGRGGPHCMSMPLQRDPI
ncbi:MAG: arginine deiminase [Firmicutes bacterium]|nr:arginine deiminase [Bacillota bacterium]